MLSKSITLCLFAVSIRNFTTAIYFHGIQVVFNEFWYQFAGWLFATFYHSQNEKVENLSLSPD